MPRENPSVPASSPYASPVTMSAHRARLVQVNESVAYGWNAEPATQEAMAEHRRDLLASATARCLSEIGASFDTLAEIRDDREPPRPQERPPPRASCRWPSRSTVPPRSSPAWPRSRRPWPKPADRSRSHREPRKDRPVGTRVAALPVHGHTSDAADRCRAQLARLRNAGGPPLSHRQRLDLAMHTAERSETAGPPLDRFYARLSTSTTHHLADDLAMPGATLADLAAHLDEIDRLTSTAEALDRPAIFLDVTGGPHRRITQ